MPSADRYFRGLPCGRTLRNLLADNTIWINYDANMRYDGEAVVGGQELCISGMSCRMGRWTILATLIHELAHINGTGGGHAAEEALVHCGLGRKDRALARGGRSTDAL